MNCKFSGEEGVGGGGGVGGKQRHNSSDKSIRDHLSKHPSSSPVRLTGAKSPSPQGGNYPMVSYITSFIFNKLILKHTTLKYVNLLRNAKLS